MDANLLNQFILATDQVFKQVANLAIQKKEVKFYQDGAKFQANVATIIGFTGALKGQIVIIVNEEMAMKFASAIMMGMPVEEFNEMAESGICEMANMISGEAARRLHELGYICDLTVPSIVKGKTLEIGFSPKTPLFCVEFESIWGPIKMVMRFETVK